MARVTLGFSVRGLSTQNLLSVPTAVPPQVHPASLLSPCHFTVHILILSACCQLAITSLSSHHTVTFHFCHLYFPFIIFTYISQSYCLPHYAPPSTSRLTVVTLSLYCPHLNPIRLLSTRHHFIVLPSYCHFRFCHLYFPFIIFTYLSLLRFLVSTSTSFHLYWLYVSYSLQIPF